jgi:hypothetical protein
MPYLVIDDPAIAKSMDSIGIAAQYASLGETANFRTLVLGSRALDADESLRDTVMRGVSLSSLKLERILSPNS